ncbi:MULTISPECIES: enoyl-CoA hydratase/isomerase family protein [Rhodococcus]|uniref:enoyl-CoA hydratase/isomerase family protein n=1 Tax=Rhodococcus TaxID=1827 RepID=UPI00071D24C3|nr:MULTISPECIES: enoyl-CoA hydratase-related protein [Rhodococcus]ANQ75960.1 enoyl-CoA hydratase [Rhodococcus sp. 008]KSU70666.1 enoyl-CoA hydratase [Rhodococcus qingshengii]SCC64258.1 Enoyl-CoA hydratase/carnithine racemase [Rhodococcus qingshengii]
MSADAARTDLETCYYERVVDGVVVLTLNRPDRGNGVVPELARDLLTVLETLEPDHSVRAVVLTGAGKQFSAGADLIAMRDYLRDELPVTKEPYNARVLHPITQRLTTSRLIFIAAINGGATAGGLDFALACDIRVASERAKLGETYINMGLAPGNGGSWFLPKLVGSGMAAELALTGEVVDADRALEIGLVGRVVPHEDLIPVAIRVAAQVAGKPWRALDATKQALRASWQADLTSSMATSFWTTSALHHTDDLHEAVDAFVEKRTPVFNKDVAQGS